MELTKERLEELLEYLLEQKEMRIKWKEEEEIKREVAIRHEDDFGIRFRSENIKRREGEISKINDLVDLVQEAHFKKC